MVFYGEFTVSVTVGGRVAIPKKIRENLKGETCILTKGFDTCLAGYDKDDWQKRTQELLGVSLLEKENIEKKRVIFSGANELVFDDQGRIVLPKTLTAYMKLASDTITIIGVGDHFEIWDSHEWNMYLKKVNV